MTSKKDENIFKWKYWVILSRTCGKGPDRFDGASHCRYLHTIRIPDVSISGFEGREKMARFSPILNLFLILASILALTNGNIWCDRCECIGRLIRCRQIDVSVLLRRSESREVEMKAVWTLDFKHSLIPDVKFMLKTVPKIFPAVKNLDLRGMGICLTEMEQFFAAVQDDCGYCLHFYFLYFQKKVFLSTL